MRIINWCSSLLNLFGNYSSDSLVACKKNVFWVSSRFTSFTFCVCAALNSNNNKKMKQKKMFKRKFPFFILPVLCKFTLHSQSQMLHLFFFYPQIPHKWKECLFKFGILTRENDAKLHICINSTWSKKIHSIKVEIDIFLKVRKYAYARNRDLIKQKLRKIV